jgi:sarcosine oxidase
VSDAAVIVVGLGAMGSATCAQLAARGVHVLGLDRFVPPHDRGSTHGESRITRLAIGEGPEYVPLVQRSHVLWDAIEARTGLRLREATGGLILGPADSGFLAQTRACAEQFGIAHENLDPAALAERFPMFSAPTGTEGYYEPAAGYVRPEAAVAAQLALARRDGGRLRLGETVRAWAATAHGVVVHTDAASYSAEQLVLCAGPWITALFPDGAEHFGVYRQLQLWFPIRGAVPERMPVFVWDFGGERRGVEHLRGFYGFPPLAGAAGGVKLATESYAHTHEPDARQHPATRAEAATMYRDYVAARLPWLGPAPLRTVSCLYTSTVGSRFVIDRHPEHAQVLIVSACSGHGFKHSPAIGEAVAQWLIGGSPAIDLSPFAFRRARGPGETAPRRGRPARPR